MKRIHILLIVLIAFLVLIGTILWISPQQFSLTEFISGPRNPIIITTNKQPTIPSKEAGTGVAEEVGVTGNIDDTELPLGQVENNLSGDTEAQVTDPEVEEIINLLEELIAESETK